MSIAIEHYIFVIAVRSFILLSYYFLFHSILFQFQNILPIFVHDRINMLKEINENSHKVCYLKYFQNICAAFNRIANLSFSACYYDLVAK